MTLDLTRRTTIAGMAAFAAAPALAQSLEEKGYVLGDAPMGDENAPVTMIEYASLTCPHCASFHATSWETVKTDYIDTGKVRFIMREVFFDQFGLWATMVARSGGEENYHRMIDMYLMRQQDWYGNHVRAYNQTKNPRPIVDEIMKIGRLSGMSNQRMTEALEDRAFLERLVEDYKVYTAEDNVRSTPTFMINGEQATGSMGPAAISALIDAQLS
ncbi:MAG: DsbA family protein [Pseudomonadota bacterium]